jgi:aryl-alcohol dehydrogenase-like predicted oxidoreductase
MTCAYAEQYFGVGCTPWSPLARGILTRPLKEQTKRATTDQYMHIVCSSLCVVAHVLVKGYRELH